MQFLPAVPGRLVVHDLPRRLAGLGRGSLAFTLGHLASLYFGGTARLLFRRPLAVLFVAAAPALFLDTLAVQPLLLQPLVLRALQRRLGLLLGFALPVDFFLLVAGFILEHFALDVGALAAHFDIDGAGTALGARKLQLRLRLAPQGDLARSGVGLQVVMAVAAAQVGQQLMFRILADHGLRAVDL